MFRVFFAAGLAFFASGPAFSSGFQKCVMDAARAESDARILIKSMNTLIYDAAARHEPGSQRSPEFQRMIDSRDTMKKTAEEFATATEDYCRTVK